MPLAGGRAGRERQYDAAFRHLVADLDLEFVHGTTERRRNVLLLFVHPANAFAHDHHDLVSERRIVGNAIRDGRCEDVAMAVLVLQSLVVQRRAARGPAQQTSATGQSAIERRAAFLDVFHLRAVRRQREER